jgi:hypothetical protein
MNAATPLTTTDLIATAAEALANGGYQRITNRFPEWETTSTRLFEDTYNVVGLVAFDTCGELLRTWSDLQGKLVDVISRHVGQGEAKAWDGYLVLLTHGLAPSSESEIEAVRYNTNRLRKLVATGEDIRTTADIGRILRPLLPLGSSEAKVGRTAVLDLLPNLLEGQGISSDTTRTLIDAFRDQASPLERLHRLRARA